ncbi:MAG: osmotically inducible protein OsmC [Opitutaceae bacterium]|nr:osmotically inducible protein OsmC [Opitutaceae bacterium]|tara:strand:+ start:3730 stop:4137 length:408 start_codon:yes stop_codon:yes gene_type:complete
MVTINLEYTGDLRTQAVHGPSGTVIRTDAPTDNMGKGEYFSPTDLCAAALGACIVTTIAIKGLQKGWNLKGSTAEVQKIMSKDTPRRIAQLNVAVKIPDRFDDKDKKHMVHIAHACPVHQSLHSEVELNVTLDWV